MAARTRVGEALDMETVDPTTANPALHLPVSAGLRGARLAAATCTACPLYAHATQTVFGEGAPRASLMLVGEQPGDRAALAGRPFVGPPGALLYRAPEHRPRVDRRALTRPARSRPAAAGSPCDRRLPGQTGPATGPVIVPTWTRPRSIPLLARSIAPRPDRSVRRGSVVPTTALSGRSRNSLRPREPRVQSETGSCWLSIQPFLRSAARPTKPTFGRPLRSSRRAASS